MSNIRRKKVKKGADEIVRKTFKRSTGFLLSLLINVIIVYIIARIFSYSFNFAYNVFTDTACDPAARDYKVVEVPADSSVLDIGEALEEGEIIKDKYVFFAKIKVKGYSNKIVSGNYSLSPSMTYEQIMNIICHIKVEEEEE